LISIPTDDLARLLDARPDAFAGGLTGIEKESLRVGADGVIAQTPHPVGLGSALMHPWITTDYSEALLELITPPFVGPDHALKFLAQLQHFVYERLDDELLWSASMPCVVQGEAGIPIARYGDSNLGMMKTVYRRGLGYRYGKVMQVIAGTHFNYSFPTHLWPAWQALLQDGQPLQDFISDRYFRTIRNLLRHGWLVPYLFGASPAVCKSFLCGQPASRLEIYNDSSYYSPHATSLRMCDIGYQNSREAELGFKADYDSVDAYVASLSRAINTPCQRYADIGVKVAGEYRQLNANMLQIENEYYSSVRPKQLLVGNEKPSLALAHRGVRYIELRSLDINPFDPRGINEAQCHFLETFMLFCLLADSPLLEPQERREIDINLDAVCYRGREPGLLLTHRGRPLSLQDWGTRICESMAVCADLLDAHADGTPYRNAVAAQLAAVHDANLTFSARVLAEMDEHGEGYFDFARRMSTQHQRYFLELEPDREQTRAFENSVIQSLEEQQAIEQSDRQSFDDFLAAYFAQSL
jgi:glutamate--cysteine ligase